MRKTAFFLLLLAALPLFGQAQKGPSAAEVKFYESVIATRDEGLAVCRTVAQTAKSNIDLYAAIEKKATHPDDRAVTQAGTALVAEAFGMVKDICEAFSLLDDNKVADITKKEFPRFQKEKMPTDTRSFYINLFKLELMEVSDALAWWNRTMVAMNNGMKNKSQGALIKELLVQTLKDAPEMRKRLDAIKKRYPQENNTQ